MIYISKSFQENIEQEENKHYQQFIDPLIFNGILDEKFGMFFDEGDVSNIVVLSLLRIRDDKTNKIVKNELTNVGDKLVNQKREVFTPNVKTYVDNVGKLYSTLTTEIKEAIIMSLGLNFVIELSLDDASIFKEVMKAKRSRITNIFNQSTTKRYASNISK